MKTTLHVSYRTAKYIDGFVFFSSKFEEKGYIYMGEVEIEIPFEVPSQSYINAAQVESINAEIKEHKAKINLLENKVKDLLCIESNESAEA